MPPDHQVTLSLSSLDRLSGGEAGKIIDAAIRRVLDDLEKHPDTQARQVILTLSVARVGKEARIRLRLTAKVSLPKSSTRDTIGVLDLTSAKGEALFAPASPENPDQQLLFQ